MELSFVWCSVVFWGKRHLVSGNFWSCENLQKMWKFLKLSSHFGSESDLMPHLLLSFYNAHLQFVRNWNYSFLEQWGMVFYRYSFVGCKTMAVQTFRMDGWKDLISMQNVSIQSWGSSCWSGIKLSQ